MCVCVCVCVCVCMYTVCKTCESYAFIRREILSIQNPSCGFIV